MQNYAYAHGGQVPRGPRREGPWEEGFVCCFTTLVVRLSSITGCSYLLASSIAELHRTGVFERCCCGIDGFSVDQSCEHFGRAGQRATDVRSRPSRSDDARQHRDPKGDGEVLPSDREVWTPFARNIQDKWDHVQSHEAEGTA